MLSGMMKFLASDFRQSRNALACNDVKLRLLFLSRKESGQASKADIFPERGIEGETMRASSRFKHARLTRTIMRLINLIIYARDREHLIKQLTGPT